MTHSTDPRAVLQRYLQAERDALLGKLRGLGERDLRRPRTPTGTSLLGIVKHCLHVEYGYFGPTFGRLWPTPGELLEDGVFDTDPQADWYATAEESADGIVALYRRVWAFADATLSSLPLDSPGRVPWWGPDAGEVTLQQIAVHVIDDLARHAGQADILREQIDGSVGWRSPGDNLPEGVDWPRYVAGLEALAARFPG